MPAFEYVAKTSGGEQQRGTLFSGSMGQAVQDLASKGLEVETIALAKHIGDPISRDFDVFAAPVANERPVETSPSSIYDYSQPFNAEEVPREEPAVFQKRSYLKSHVLGPVFGKIALNNLQFFFRQFAQMLKAGVPMVQSLETLARQTRDQRLRKIILETNEHVKAGRPVSSGLQRYPETFSPLMLSLIRAGETSGNLDECLRLIAEYIESEIELRSMVRRLTFYPKVVLVFSVIMIFGTNFIIAMLTGKSGTLSSPLTTLTTWIVLAPLLIGIFLFVRVGLSNPRVKYNWDLFLLWVPYIGQTLKQLAMAKFGRAMGALYRGGVPATVSMQLAADACGNEYLRARMYPAIKQLETGAGLTETLRSTGAFSPIVLDMLQTGETTGNVDTMLTNMCDYYEEEAKTRSHHAAQVFGVLFYVAVAIYIFVAIILPFYSGYGQQIMDTATK